MKWKKKVHQRREKSQNLFFAKILVTVKIKKTEKGNMILDRADVKNMKK